MLQKLARFRLRTLLIVIAVVAMAVGWVTTKWREHQIEQLTLNEFRSRYNVQLVDETVQSTGSFTQIFM